MSDGTYGLTSTSKDRLFKKNVFMVNFIYSQSLCQKSSERKSPKKYFHISVLIPNLDYEPGFYVYWKARPAFKSKRRDLQFEVNCEGHIVKKIFLAIFFYFQSFSEIEWKRPRYPLKLRSLVGGVSLVIIPIKASPTFIHLSLFWLVFLIYLENCSVIICREPKIILPQICKGRIIIEKIFCCLIYFLA